MTKPFEQLSPREFHRLTTLKKTRYLAELQAHLSVLRQAPRAPAASGKVNSSGQQRSRARPASQRDPPPSLVDEAGKRADDFQACTVTRRNVAGIDVAPLPAVFCRVNSSFSSLERSAALPFLAAASNAFIVGP